MTDFDLIYPHQAQFLRQLSAVVAQRRLIEADASLSDESKRKKIRQLTVGSSSTNIDDIGYVCVYVHVCSLIISENKFSCLRETVLAPCYVDYGIVACPTAAET